MTNELNFRTKLNIEDGPLLKQITADTGFFKQYEVDIAEELMLENINKGEDVSGYGQAERPAVANRGVGVT